MFMDNWKTMLEVAKELGITKSLVRYHRQKLEDIDIKKQGGVTYISPQGVMKIKSFLRSTDYDESFETIVKNQLSLIQELLMSRTELYRENTRDTIEQFREFLIRSPDSLKVLHELEESSKGTPENEFYFVLADYIELKSKRHYDFFVE